MCFELNRLGEGCVAVIVSAFVWFVFRVNAVMHCQITLMCKTLLTETAEEWFDTGMGPLMCGEGA